jgi:citrate lyase synthetase
MAITNEPLKLFTRYFINTKILYETLFYTLTFFEITSGKLNVVVMLTSANYAEKWIFICIVINP